MSKQTLIKGTLILTLAGMLTRLMGFFYKIYLSNVMEPRNLGLYQLVFPVYGLCFTLYGAGLQTAISQLVANKPDKRKAILLKGIIMSLTIACSLSVLVYLKCDLIAAKFLMEPDAGSSLKVLAYVFPFCGITACIQGYYYGLKQTRVPAASQLFEQMVRIASVFLIATYLGNGSAKVTCELAVLGIVFGEIGANIYCILSFHKSFAHFEPPKNERKILRSLTALTVPLTGTKLIVSLLHSLEAILIPYMLKVYGLSGDEALSTYGILTGMTLPFLLFPSAITNAFALLILPTVSEAQATNNQYQIKKTSELSVKYSLLLGLYSTCAFFLFGKDLGLIFFHNDAAGSYMTILSWLCPFLYLSTTLGSIINGLGKAHLTFFNTVVTMGIRILFLCLLVPSKGLYGYLLGQLVSQIMIAIMDFFTLKIYTDITIHSIDWLLKPGMILLGLGFLLHKTFLFLNGQQLFHSGILILSICALLGIFYLLFLFVVRVISLEELKG